MLIMTIYWQVNFGWVYLIIQPDDLKCSSTAIFILNRTDNEGRDVAYIAKIPDSGIVPIIKTNSDTAGNPEVTGQLRCPGIPDATMNLSFRIDASSSAATIKEIYPIRVDPTDHSLISVDLLIAEPMSSSARLKRQGIRFMAGDKGARVIQARSYDSGLESMEGLHVIAMMPRSQDMRSSALNLKYIDSVVLLT
jgi:hypothetical protein